LSIDPKHGLAGGELIAPGPLMMKLCGDESNQNPGANRQVGVGGGGGGGGEGGGGGVGTPESPSCFQKGFK